METIVTRYGRYQRNLVEVTNTDPFADVPTVDLIVLGSDMTLFDVPAADVTFLGGSW